MSTRDNHRIVCQTVPLEDSHILHNKVCLSPFYYKAFVNSSYSLTFHLQVSVSVFFPTFCISTTLDLHQFAYCTNRSTEDTITTAIHVAMTHLNNPSSYVRMMLSGFVPALSTMTTVHLI